MESEKPPASKKSDWKNPNVWTVVVILTCWTILAILGVHTALVPDALKGPSCHCPPPK